MVIRTEPHRPLMHCSVLYLGYSSPTPGATGLDVLTNPLKNAYPVHNSDELVGINSFITIYTSGIQLQMVGSSRPTVIWFPIQNLYVAAAKKLVTMRDKATGRIQESRFVELTKPEADQSTHAPLFSFMVPLNGEDQRFQCYTFLTKNNDTAISLVEAARHAYTNKNGHSANTIPASVAAKETMAEDSDSEESSSGSGHTLRVININDANDDIDLFPSKLAKRHRLDNLRPVSNLNMEREEHNGAYHNASAYGEMPSARTQPAHSPVPPIQIPTYTTLQSQGPRFPSPNTDMRTRTTYVRPPPIYIRAPPPRMVHIRHPPQIIRTPTHIIRQPVVIEKRVPYPVVQEVRGETPPPQIVERPYPVPVRQPTPEPEIIEVPVAVPSPPQIIRQPVPEICEVPVPVPVRARTPEPVVEYIEREVPVYVEGPTRYITQPPEIREVPVPVRAPTPEPRIEYIDREVPVYVEGPTRYITQPPEVREVQVPVPYEVQLPPPPPEIREIYIERPPKIKTEEIPVPMPYEVPVHVPIEVPRFFPVPVKGGKKSWNREEPVVYDDRFLRGESRMGQFVRSIYPEDVGGIHVGYPKYPTRREGRQRRGRSSSSSSSSSSDVDYHDPALGLRHGVSGIRIRESSGEQRQRRRHDSPEVRGYGRVRSRRDEPIIGYDFYRPAEHSDKHKKGRKKHGSQFRRYRVEPRYDRSDNHFESERMPKYHGESDDDIRFNRHMPAHLSESVSEFPRGHDQYAY